MMSIKVLLLCGVAHNHFKGNFTVLKKSEEEGSKKNLVKAEKVFERRDLMAELCNFSRGIIGSPVVAEFVGMSTLVSSERDSLRAIPIVISDSESDVEITSDTRAKPEAQCRDAQHEAQRKKRPRPTLVIDLESPPSPKRSRLQRTARPPKEAPVVVELDCDYEIPGESSDMLSYECPICYESCRRSRNVLSCSRCKAYEKVHAHCTLQRQCPSCGGSLTAFTKAKKDLLGVDVIEIPDSPPAPKPRSIIAPKSTTRPFFAVQVQL